MALNTTYKPAVAQGNGIIKEFSYSFNPLSLSYIKVYFEVGGKWVEQKTGWSATVSDSGGVVTFLTAPTTRVSIERDIPESQPTSYTTSSGFQAKVIENSFDLLTGMVQELKDASDRSVKVEVGDNQTPEELLEEVYNKLDSATAIAGDAINAANQAQTAADNATAAVNQAEQTLTEVTNYVDLAKTDIEDTKNTAISTIDSTVSNAKGEIANTVVSAKADINNAVDEATMNITDIVSDAEGSITNIAVTEANKAIANAAQEATDTATANLNSYVDGTVKPSLQTYVDQAQADANSAATSMEQAALSATAASNYASNASADADNAAESATHAATSATDSEHYSEDSRIWAEGTDSEVQGLGGVHSSKVWSETAQAVVAGKQDISTAINYKNITNCITEIPHDIKLELKDGTLTLKAGSKVYVPNGAGVFDEYTSTSDKTFENTTNGQYLLFTTKNFSYLTLRDTTKAFSGDSATGIQYAVWYDTTNNLVKYTSSGTEWLSSDGWSLPLALVTISGGKITSIDQVFNGFGYIGSTVFALPGVKGLIPNGRNADGSLKNTEFTLNGVKIWNTVSANLHSKILYDLSTDNLLCPNDSTFLTRRIYSEKENIWTLDGTRANYCELGSFVADSASPYAVTSFAPKTAFHAVDYNDSSWVSAQAMPSGKYIDLTLGASSSEYIAPANGYFSILGAPDTAPSQTNGVFISMSCGEITNRNSGTISRGYGVFIPAKKGKSMFLEYQNFKLTGYSWPYFRFVYAEGEK